jgi:hypothetical protein
VVVDEGRAAQGQHATADVQLGYAGYLASAAFVALLEEVFEAPVAVLATVHQRAHVVTDAIKARPDAELVSVTAEPGTNCRRCSVTGLFGGGARRAESEDEAVSFSSSSISRRRRHLRQGACGRREHDASFLHRQGVLVPGRRGGEMRERLRLSQPKPATDPLAALRAPRPAHALRGERRRLERA